MSIVLLCPLTPVSLVPVSRHTRNHSVEGKDPESKEELYSFCVYVVFDLFEVGRNIKILILRNSDL